MIAHELMVTPAELATETGWILTPEGLCRGERCVPFTGGRDERKRIDLRAVAERLRMPLVHDEDHGIWAIGPEAGGRVLAGAEVPRIVLVDFAGNPFDLASLRGRKVVLHAWASW